MRFICPEVNPESRISDLYRTEQIKQAVVEEKGYNLKLVNSINTNKQGDLYQYSTTTMSKNYLTIYPISYLEFKATDYSTFLNVTHSTISSYSYQWIINKLSQLNSDYFLTIFKEDEILLSLPARTAASKKISSYTFQARKYTEKNNITFQNFNLLSDYSVYLNYSKQIRCSDIDQNMKNHILNCYNSKLDITWIVSGEQAQPLDYYEYNGKTYLIVNSKEDNGSYLYTGIQESNNNYSQSTSIENFSLAGMGGILYDDQQIDALSLGKGASPPTLTAYPTSASNGLLNSFDYNSLNQVYANMQLSHQYQAGTPITPHVHYYTTGNTGNIIWGLNYSYAAIDGSPSAEFSTTITVAASTIHKIVYFGAISATSMGESSVINFRLYRDGAVDTSTCNTFLLGFDCHYLKNKMGTTWQ